MSRAVGNCSLLKAIGKRGYSTQVAIKPISPDINVGISTNQVRLVAAYPNYPLSKVSLTYKAGARYELPDNLGITHILRQGAVLSTQELTSFSLHRVPSQLGFNLYASVDREAFTYSVEAHPNAISSAVEYLVNVATKPSFKPWELSDNVKRIKLDLLGIPSEVKALDLLHKAAYRNALGNSLFCDSSRVDRLTCEHCWNFVNDHFTTSRAQITSTSLTQAELEKIIPKFDLESGSGPATLKSVYTGGEQRVSDFKEYNTYIAVAGEAPGFTQKDYLSFAVLQHVYANNPGLKYGTGQSILNKALSKAGVIGAVTGIYANYSDSSLVGFFLAVSNSDAVKGYDAVLNAFLKSDITDQDVAKAKTFYKNSLLDSAYGTGIVDLLAKQIAADTIISPLKAADAVDAVTTADVKQAAKKLLSGKLAVGAYGGDVASLPYIDTIKK
ncbi:hypothetical protein V9T40_002257 [Parthenolecanium corni]|uniref:Cytochrome b-c1 complex subunit 2, mitochondrial n=1 Tax=Parthenolecanium corni TaxID=536013 RepID=A0AAN9Y422_9HEMI